MKSNKGFFAATAGFIKKYIYFILLFICVAAIVTIIIVATTQKTPAPPVGNNDQQKEEPLPEDPIPIAKTPMVFSLPVKEGALGNDFSFTDFVWLATQGRYQTHKAIDFKAPAGTNVYAVYDGTVEAVYDDTLEGTVIVIKHQDNVKTVYKSLDSSVSVRVGDTVRTNDVIGKVSDSMTYEVAEGPHLHFEVWKDGKIIDPYIYLVNVEK